MTIDKHEVFIKQAYDTAMTNISKCVQTTLDQKITKWIDSILENAEANKGLLAVLITLTLHKVVDEKQDIRLHQAQLPGGFSGRTIDSKYVTPFLKRMQFPSMAESGWLTRSLEQPYPYDLNYQGKIRPVAIKESFLLVVDSIETKGVSALNVLEYIFERLIVLRDAKNIVLAKPQKLSISRIIRLLERHFTAKYSGFGASRLPVLAIYAAYQCMMGEVARFREKILCKLESHNSADRRSGRIGDIDVIDKNNVSFEGVEIKHEIKITPQLVKDAYEKFKGEKTERYYLLTTANMDSADVDGIDNEIEWIANVHGCQVIVNGVYSTLRYYLRLLSNPAEFIDRYVELLQCDDSVKFQHNERWNALVDELAK